MGLYAVLDPVDTAICSYDGAAWAQQQKEEHLANLVLLSLDLNGSAFDGNATSHAVFELDDGEMKSYEVCGGENLRQAMTECRPC